MAEVNKRLDISGVARDGSFIKFCFLYINAITYTSIIKENK